MSKNYFHSVFKNTFVTLVLLVGHVALAQTVTTLPDGSFVLTYTSNDSFSVPAGVSQIEYLVVAGGGGGGAWRGGGGGAGGVQSGMLAVSEGQNLNVTIGQGGAGAPGGTNNTRGANGQNSVFGSVTAIGGGGGGMGQNSNNAGGSGGSGGGRGGAATGGTQSPGTGVAGQGFSGGNSFDDDGIVASRAGGGGGGAGAIGSAATNGQGGNGGAGVVSTITGSAVVYAGGGGGASNGSGAGTGGAGGGGNGVTSGNGQNGQANTGGGGGGAGGGFQATNAGGNGGSGVVIIKYRITDDTPTGALEFAAGDGNPSTTNGPTQSTSIRFRNNTNNPVGNTFETYSPEVRADFQLTNQQYTNSTQNSNGNTGDPNNPGAAIGFIYGSNVGEPVFPLMNLLGATASTEYTSTDINSPGIGIDPSANRAVIISEGVGVLDGQARSGRYQMHDVVVSFNQPLTNPVMHLVGLGGSAGGFGFTAELELLTSGVSLARLSGTSNFVVQGNEILNPAAVPSGVGDVGNGSVLISGENITELTFRVFVRGQSGATGTEWGNTFEDAFKMGFSTRVSDLSVDISVDNDTPEFGDTIEFTIDAANLGASTNTGVEIAALLPPGLDFVSATPSFGTYDSVTGIWTIPGDVTAGATANLTIQAEVVSRNTALMTMTAEISGDLADPDRSNNIARSFIQRFPDTDGDGVPDLFDEDSDNDGILDIDEKVANPFSIEGGNSFILSDIPSIGNGDEIVIDFTEMDNSFSLNFNGQDINLNGRDFQYQIGGGNIPATDNFVRFVSDDCQYQACGIPPVWAQTAEPLIRVIINSDGLVTFLGRRTPSDPLELMYPIDGFNQVTWLENNTLIIGQEEVGPTNAAGTVYYTKDTDGDGIPDHLDLDSDGDGCPDANEYYDDPTADADGNGTFGSGSPAVDANGRVTAADYNGTGLAAVVDDEVNSGCRNDLAISMEVDDEFPIVNDEITFTITAENLGVGNNFDTQIEALLPDGYSFVGATTSIGNYDSNTGIWNIPGEFEANQEETLTISAIILEDADDYNFIASIEGRFPDTDLSNNEANLEIIPRCGTLIDNSNDLVVFGTTASGPFVTTWDTTNPGSSSNNQITIPTEGTGYNYNVFWINTNDNTMRGQEVDVTGDLTITFPEPGIYQVEICGDFPRIFFNNTGDKDKILNVNQWGDKRWTSMAGAFDGAINLDVVANDTPDLSQVTSVANMFRGNESLVLNNQINNWDVSNVTSFNNMFAGATQFNQNIDQWQINPNAISFSGMFDGAESFNQDISMWDVDNIQSFNNMFRDAVAFNQDLSSWNTGSVTNFSGMFNGASNFNQNLEDWNIENAQFMNNMLDNTALSLENYDDTLNSWGFQNVNPNVTVGAEGLTFCYGDLGRDELINNNGWTFIGDNTCEFVFEQSGDWETENRWMDNRRPEPRHTARVLADLTIPQEESITNLTVEEGVEVTILEGRQFKILGDIENNGSFKGEGGEVVLEGQSLQTLSGGGDYERIRLANSQNAELTEATDIFGSLRVESGNFISNGNATFRCDFSGNNPKTAQIDILNGDVVGEVTTEQCYPGRRAFRFVSPSVRTNSSIRENWQENASAWNDDPNPGYGTHITGLGQQNPVEGTDDTTNGFDWQPSGNPSMFVWDNGASQWSPIANTNNTNLVAGQPIRLNIRGSRAVDLRFNTSATSNTILRETGIVERGTVTFTQSDLNISGTLEEDDLILVGNPFQSIVNLQQVINSSTGVKPFVAIWDPRVGGEANTNSSSTELGGRGGYVVVNSSDGGVSNSTSNMNEFLQPKQALFFYADGSGNPVNIVFEEVHKNINEDQTTVFSESANFSLELQLFDEMSYNSNSTSRDAFRVNFVPGGNNGIDQNDAPKQSNVDENLARMHPSLLSIEERDLPQDEEVLQLFINQYRVSDYVFKSIIQNLPQGVTPYLKDNYTDSLHELEEGEVSISFTVDANVNASTAFNRFSIVFDVTTMNVEDFVGNEISLYPNPAKSGYTNLALPNAIGESVEISIFNNLGQRVLQLKETVNTNGEIRIDNINFPTGIYQLKANTVSGKTFKDKLMVE